MRSDKGRALPLFDLRGHLNISRLINSRDNYRIGANAVNYYVPFAYSISKPFKGGNRKSSIAVAMALISGPSAPKFDTKAQVFSMTVRQLPSSTCAKKTYAE